MLTKLPHYVLPLYPAIAILDGRRAGAPRAVAIHGCARRCLVVRDSGRRFGGWRSSAPITLTRQPVFPAWPFVAAALIFRPDRRGGSIEDGRAERSLLNAVVAAMFLSLAIYGVVVPALTRAVSERRGRARCCATSSASGPKVAAAGFHEPSLVFHDRTPRRC